MVADDTSDPLSVITDDQGLGTLVSDATIAGGDFTLGEELGRGSYAVCYAARRRHGKAFHLCAKVIDIREEESEHQAATEIEVLKAVAGMHSALPTMVTACVATSSIAIITQRGTMNLKEWAKAASAVSEELLRPHALAVAGALAALHRAGYAHLDVKPANIMLVDGRAVLIDFGMAQALTTGKLAFGHSRDAVRRLAGASRVSDEQAGGTASYFAPETVLADRHGVECPATAARDAWALGVTILSVLRHGDNPFDRKAVTASSAKLATEEAILAGAAPAITALRLSPALDHLLKRLLRMDPVARFGLDEVATHPWATAAAAAASRAASSSSPPRLASPRDRVSAFGRPRQLNHHPSLSAAMSKMHSTAAEAAEAAEPTAAAPHAELSRRPSASSLALAGLRHDLRPAVAAARLRHARAGAGRAAALATERVVMPTLSLLQAGLLASGPGQRFPRM
jgi:serine/threonine protein kinase